MPEERISSFCREECCGCCEFYRVKADRLRVGSYGGSLAGAQYSQKQETEADDYGFEFSIKHNLDPYAMYNALNKLLELSADAPKESKFQKMFSSHPDTAKRVARAKEKADEYMKNKQ